MKVVIPGGSGHLGCMLARHFDAGVHEVVLLSRRDTDQGNSVSEKQSPRIVHWDACRLDKWAEEIDGADLIINLAGRSVNCRYNETNKRIIKESRTVSTRIVGEAIAAAKSKPRAWLQMSTATIYAHRFDAGNDEFTGLIDADSPGRPPAWNFSIDVAKSWEQTLDEAAVPPSVRRIKLRTAIVMSTDPGGPFNVLLNLVKLGLGGQSGTGKQFISWIIGEDFVRAIEFILEHEEISDAVNLASPNPLPNAEFMRLLREAWGMPIGLPATEWMLELGAVALQSETELILKSRRVIPGKLQAAGFQFNYPNWSDAAKELCRQAKTTCQN